MRSLKVDPSSRLGYRLQRMWLTPLVRAAFRVVLPCAAMGLGGYAYLSQPHVMLAIEETVTQAKASIQERPEFMVHLMSVSGASDEVAEQIRATIPLDLPSSSFDFDLEALRTAVVALAPVEDATLRIRSGGVLEIDIIERVPMLVWRNSSGLALLDGAGFEVAQITARAERGDLPVIAGRGADAAAAEALALISAARPIADRMRGLRRMGARRWDMVLDRNQVIMLPEVGAVRALESVILLDQAQDLLARAITHVDLRNPRRPTLRLAQSSLEELHKIKGLKRGANPNE